MTAHDLAGSSPQASALRPADASGLGRTGLLAGKRLLVTGVLTKSSIAFHVARIAQQEGAQLVLTSYGRAMSLTEATAERLPQPPPVLRLDVTSPVDFAGLADAVREELGGVDGVVHSIAFAPQNAMGGAFLDTSWKDAATALEVSAYSFKALVTACLPLMSEGASVVGLDFDATQAWPGYDWMGVSKAALESVTRYLALYLGERRIRVNLVASGLVRTLAARSIPGSERLEEIWRTRPPMTWDVDDPVPAAKACAVLLSDWLPSTTGEILHVDGGMHAVVVCSAARCAWGVRSRGVRTPALAMRSGRQVVAADDALTDQPLAVFPDQHVLAGRAAVDDGLAVLRGMDDDHVAQGAHRPAGTGPDRGHTEPVPYGQAGVDPFVILAGTYR
jgi:enoyl-[acyl-carrier protein] reductase I